VLRVGPVGPAVRVRRDGGGSRRLAAAPSPAAFRQRIKQRRQSHQAQPAPKQPPRTVMTKQPPPPVKPTHSAPAAGLKLPAPFHGLQGYLGALDQPGVNKGTIAPTLTAAGPQGLMKLHAPSNQGSGFGALIKALATPPAANPANVPSAQAPRTTAKPVNKALLPIIVGGGALALVVGFL